MSSRSRLGFANKTTEFSTKNTAIANIDTLVEFKCTFATYRRHGCYRVTIITQMRPGC